MRSRDVSQRTLVVSDVRQEQPCLQRGMESIRMKLELRVGTALSLPHHDGLNVIQRLRPGASHVSKQRSPPLAGYELLQFGNGTENLGPDRHAPGNRIALLLLPAVELAGQQRIPQARERRGGKEFANLDEAGANESFS